MAKNTVKAKAGPSAKPPASGPISPAEAVYLRNDFYRDGYRTAWKVAFSAILVAVVSIVIALFLVMKGPEFRYFATTQDGRVIPLVPLQQSNHANHVVTQWVTDALVDTFTFAYTDYRMRLSNATSKWFTNEGAEAILKALKDSGNLDAIIERKMFASLVVDETPVVVDKGGIGDVFAWKIQVPATISYRTATGSSSQRVLFQLVVVRRSELLNASGLGISQVIMKPSK